MLKRALLILGIYMMLTINIFASINPNEYVNASKPGETTTNKIINYIEGREKTVTGNAFCIGKDKIYYYESFLDEERDYYNLPFSQHHLSNSVLSEQQKQISPINLQMKYEHNPNYYHNPVAVSSLSGKWYDIEVVWNSEQEKWELHDPTNTILFENPTDDKRGEWKIYLKGKDSTGKAIFDKESIGFASFRVHKAPIPKFSYSIQNNLVTLTDAGSYDIDGEYRSDKGIKNWYWSIKVDGEWIKIGQGKTVTYNTNGKAVSDYSLTVEDYDGAFASTSKSGLIKEKPLADFEFRIGSDNGASIQYLYEGNTSHENVYVYPTIAWNDDAYDPSMYGNTVTGIRSEKWVSLKTMQERNNHLSFSNEVLNARFNENKNNNFLKVLLEVKNKFDLADTTNKSLEIRQIELTDLTSTGYVHTNCGFEVGKDAIIKIQIKNSSLLQDLIYKVDIPQFNITDLELIPSALDNTVLTATIPLDARNSFWQPLKYEFNYSIKVYSKRLITNSNKVLHQVPGKALIHTPLDLVPFINDQQENITVNGDEVAKFSATTREYAEKVTVSVPVILIDPSTNERFNPDTPIQLYPKNNNTLWERNLIIDSESLTEEKTLTARYDATSFNKRDTDTKYLNFKGVAYRLLNFRVVQVKDYSLESYYKDLNGRYQDKDMNVNEMAIDPLSFAPYPVESLKKGYLFEFEIDSINFNGTSDSINIVPSFYSVIGNTRDTDSKDAFWIDSNKVVQKVGDGAHASYKTITLDPSKRTIIDKNRATWRGEYFIPATTFLTNKGTSIDSAKNNALSGDIIVNFDIKGYKNGSMKFDYNLKQWGLERTKEKFPYLIGDVIRYGEKSNLDDLTVTRPR